jgi:pyruvate/2-oxoglutarate dehydrogenase complex dihydrolipoamide dehydrogenase (E3) component
MIAPEYDLVVVGGSSVGRYAAAIAQNLGKRVALVEPAADSLPQTPWLRLQALLQSSSLHRPRIFSPATHLSQVWRWGQGVAEVVAEAGIEGQSLPLLAAAGVDVVLGNGAFCRRPQLGVVVTDHPLWAKAYLLAPATQSIVPAIAGLDSVDYWTVDRLAQMLEIPRRLLILGNDPNSLELAQCFQRLGSQVTLLPQSPLFPYEDPESIQLLQVALEAEGVTIVPPATGLVVKPTGQGCQVEWANQRLEADILLVTGCPQQCSPDLNLDAVEVQWQPHIRVNRRLQTTQPRIYACGDSLGGYALPDLAQYEAEIAVQNALSIANTTVDYAKIPWAIWTDPEFARVGLTAAQAERRYEGEVLVLEHYFKILPKAQLQDQTTGLCKLIVHRNGQILGGHILGTAASEIIGTVAIAVQNRLKVAALGNLRAIAPTFSTILQETARLYYRSR